MTIIEMELRLHERQARILAEVEHDRLLHLAFPNQNWRVRLANALYTLGERLDPPRLPVTQARVTHQVTCCQDC